MSRNWFPKKINKGYLSELAVIGSSVFSITYYVKHTLLLKYYKNYTTLKGNDGPVNPSPRLIRMVKTVEQDLKDLASENTPVIPYIVPGLRILHAGTLGTIQGGIVGLPLYFEFTDKGDVDDKIKKEEPFFDENALEELYDCFLLSDKAKKYAIAQQILCVNTLQVYIETLVPFGIAGIIKLTCDFVPTLFNIQGNLIYTLILALGLVIWRNVHSITKNYFESQIEDTLAGLGREYVEGAIEFYSKALERRRFKLEWKDQNSNVLNTISDKINLITSRREISMNYKLAFYKSKVNAYSNNDNYEEESSVVKQ